MRVALAIFNHEANCFSPHSTGMADFEARMLARKGDVLANWHAAATEEAGAMTVFADAPECQVVPLLGARAESGAPMPEHVFRAILDDLLALLAEAGPIDGVLLVLHGAMMSEGTPDATGEVLRAVRAAVGPDVPVIGTLDLHANVTEQMVAEATALIGYHTAPHVDQFATGQRAARLLLDVLAGRVRPRTALVRLPMILPPENSSHMRGPLAEVMDKALELERDGTIEHAALYPTQPWLDTDSMASAVCVVTNGDAAAARQVAQMLAGMFWSRRSEFVTELVPPDEAIRRALALETGTVVFCDSADATSSGSTGDSTAILQALVDAGEFEPTALVNIVDAEVVEQAIASGIGRTLTVSVGGKIAPGYFAPVSFTGYVKTISDGSFRFKGPAMRGMVQHRGRTVVLYSGGIHLVVMERPVTQWDPELYRSLGEEPGDARIVQVKSPMAFRAAYESITENVVVIAAPGAATPQLDSLPWKRVPRPIYPLDLDARWP